MILEINDNIKDYFYKNYNILYHDNLLNFYQDYSILIDNLNKIKKENFSNNDKILIEQFDTDFYDKSLKLGLHNRNIIECLRQCDIPFFSVIFITNNFNIHNELLSIIESEEGFPIIVNTISSSFTIIKDYKENNVNFNFIKPAVCLMGGSNRLHRNSIYDFIKSKNLYNKISVNYKNEQ